MPSLPVLLLTDSDVYDNTAGFLITGSDVMFIIYCFIIEFNLYFFVESGFAFYKLRRRHVILPTWPGQHGPNRCPAAYVGHVRTGGPWIYVDSPPDFSISNYRTTELLWR